MWSPLFFLSSRMLSLGAGGIACRRHGLSFWVLPSAKALGQALFCCLLAGGFISAISGSKEFPLSQISILQNTFSFSFVYPGFGGHSALITAGIEGEGFQCFFLSSSSCKTLGDPQCDGHAFFVAGHFISCFLGRSMENIQSHKDESQRAQNTLTQVCYSNIELIHGSTGIWSGWVMRILAPNFKNHCRRARYSGLSLKRVDLPLLRRSLTVCHTVRAPVKAEHGGSSPAHTSRLPCGASCAISINFAQLKE